MSFTWSVFGHSLGFLRHGVFGQFSGQQQTHGGLDLSRCDGGALVVASETRLFTSDVLEDVVDERVHDAIGVQMNLLQHFVHVDSIALLPRLLSSFFETLSSWDFTSSMIFLLLLLGF